MRTLITTNSCIDKSKFNDISYLGTWCLSYKDEIETLSNENLVINYHWDGRNKLYKDFIYLQNLVSNVTAELGEQLNAYHNTNYPKYWELLLDIGLTYI